MTKNTHKDDEQGEREEQESSDSDRLDRAFRDDSQRDFKHSGHAFPSHDCLNVFFRKHTGEAVDTGLLHCKI